jgi:hypothetical protein
MPQDHKQSGYEGGVEQNRQAADAEMRSHQFMRLG